MLVPIGRVGRPHGLDGAFVVERASQDDRRWRVGATVLADGVPATITLTRKAGGSRRAIRLDRDVPRGTDLTIDASELPAPDPDSFYVFQLVGLDAIDEDGAPLGRVVEVHPGAANDNVELHDGRLVPLVEDAVREIDIEGGKLVVVRSFLL
jgi:16S rRNA processing protein RimM